MKFLGQVNPFHGRLEDGKVHFASMSMDSPEHAGTPSRPVRVFIRPHDIDVHIQGNGHPCFRAVVTRSTRPGRTCGWTCWPNRANACTPS